MIPKDTIKQHLEMSKWKQSPEFFDLIKFILPQLFISLAH